MKDVRYAIRNLLLANATVSSMVGGFRVHAIKAPQGQTDPSIVFNKVTELEYVVMDGSSKLTDAQIQVDAWALDADTAIALGNAAHDALIFFRGLVEYGSNSPRDYVDVQGIFLSTAREDYDSESRMYRMSRDYHVWFVNQ